MTTVLHALFTYSFLETLHSLIMLDPSKHACDLDELGLMFSQCRGKETEAVSRLSTSSPHGFYHEYGRTALSTQRGHATAVFNPALHQAI